MTLPDQAGVLGVGLTLIAYAAAAFGRMQASRWPSLALNLVGSCLILYSLAYQFNLAAFLMEASWACVAFIGLIRLLVRRQG